jgi:cyclophilin family peptidyl-prolyl cis-trans isomerase
MLRGPSRAIVLVLPLAAIAGCGGGSHTSAIPSGGGSSSAGGTNATPAGVGAKATTAVPARCKPVAEPKPKPDGKLNKPSAKLDASKAWVATVRTNCGTFAFRLDLKSAPKASASIAYLAGKKFFDGTIFHRIVPGFVIQGGDPTGQGSGGPGYSTVDKPPSDASYKKGTVAMAKTGTEPPGTAGSQFFVVTGADAGLPPDYAVVGKVTRGMDVVQRIGKLGDQSEQPRATVEILSLRVAPR